MKLFSCFCKKDHMYHRALIGALAWSAGALFAVWGIHFALAEEATPFFGGNMGDPGEMRQMAPRMDGPMEGERRMQPQPPGGPQEMKEGMPGPMGENRPPFEEFDKKRDQGPPIPGRDREPTPFPSERGMNQSEFRGHGEFPEGPNERMMEDGNEEDQQKRDEQEEERRQAQMKQQFSRIKQDFKRTQPMLKRMSARIASMEKSGITVSSDIKEMLSSATKEFDIVLNAKTIEDEGVMEAMDGVQSKMQELQEAMPKLEMLARLPAMLKKVQSEIKKLDSALAKAKKMAAKSKIDISSTIQEFEAAVGTIKAGYESAKSKIASGDADEVMETLQDEVFEEMQEAQQYHQAILMLQNVGSSLGKMTSFVSQSRAKFIRMQKAGQDVAAEMDLLKEMDEQVKELKGLLAQKPLPADEVRELVEDIWSKRQEIEEALGQGAYQTTFSKEGSAEAKDFAEFKSVDFSF